jgi:hypothetical protein
MLPEAPSGEITREQLEKISRQYPVPVLTPR